MLVWRFVPALVFQQLSVSDRRWEFTGLAVGFVILSISLASLALFFFRRTIRDRGLLYFGIFSMFYALRLLSEQPTTRALFGFPPRTWVDFRWAVTCVIGIPFILFISQIVDARRRRIFRWFLAAQAVFAVIAIPVVVFGTAKRQRPADVVNSILVIAFWTLLSAYVVRMRFRGRLPNEIKIASLGFVVFAAFVLHTNLVSLQFIRGRPGLEPLGFFIFVICLGYVVAQRAFSNEERLFALSKELEIARQIQSSILPREVPCISGLEIAARYLPMSAVAGDFYDFLPIDETRVGILVADVTGHGVPAALIASMLKVAFAGQSAHADDPERVLTGLNRALCGKFEEHFVTAAYAFVDTEKSVVRYAAAGHPPLLLAEAVSGNGHSRVEVQEIEENGLMLGLFPEASYSYTEMAIPFGSRCLLYTDGVFEAQNAAFEEFGKLRLKQFLVGSHGMPVGRSTDALLAELKRWSDHKDGRHQDDDITLVLLEFRP
jgi:phosphoserine phosphatase RsbU/P